MSKFGTFLDKKFQLTEKGTTVRTEVVAGLVTFMTMVYILMVNAGMFRDLGGTDETLRSQLFNGVYIATALSAVIGTILIGLMAKLPLAQASGMGLNAFFVYSVCGFGMSYGLTYANALLFILIDGVVFVLLTVTGLRKKIFAAIPDCVKIAIPAGIGFFIAFIGLQNAGIVVLEGSTKVKLASLNLLSGNVHWFSATNFVSITDANGVSQLVPVAGVGVAPILVTFLAFILVAVLSKKNVKGAVLWGILGGTVLYYVFAALGVAFGDAASKAVFDSITFQNPLTAFKDFGTTSVGKVFTEGFDFGVYLENNSVGQLILVLITTSLAFCLVDMFDTIGTLYGACARGNLLDEKGEVPNMNQAMLADAIATCVGAVCGTSTVTTFVESSSGIAEGGKTGLVSIVVALCFFVAMFLSPIAKLIPQAATAAALVYVGVLMMNGVAKIDWLNPATSVPAFVTIAMTVMTYSISYGIGLGMITYTLIQLFTGKFCSVEKTVVKEDGTTEVVKERSYNDVVTAIIGLVFAATFFLTH